MDSLKAFVPDVSFELIPINNLVSNQEYQRTLSKRHIEKMADNFNLYQINPVKISRRDNLNFIINGQHTTEVVALVSGSRETPVWCMIYNNLDYLQEADIFAQQQKYTKALLPYEIFTAFIEADSDKHIIIKDLVEQCGLRLFKTKSNCSICAVSSLSDIYDKYGYEGLERTLRFIVKAWEGDANSLSSSMLRGVALLISTFGESLQEDLFAERLGSFTAREIMRTARERRNGSLGYAETMLMLYNKKKKSTLSMTRLYKSGKQEAASI